jgi:hypothetical protein
LVLVTAFFERFAAVLTKLVLGALTTAVPAAELLAGLLVAATAGTFPCAASSAGTWNRPLGETMDVSTFLPSTLASVSSMTRPPNSPSAMSSSNSPAFIAMATAKPSASIAERHRRLAMIAL